MRSSTDYIVIHCADTPPEMDIGAKEIRKWHVEERGWRDIGYHYVIRRDGNIELGRPVTDSGAHVRGFNSRSVGVCLVGGMGGPNFSSAQKDSLRDLIYTLERIYPDATVVGHRDLDSKKECPSFDVANWYTNGVMA